MFQHGNLSVLGCVYGLGSGRAMATSACVALSLPDSLLSHNCGQSGASFMLELTIVSAFTGLFCIP